MRIARFRSENVASTQLMVFAGVDDINEFESELEAPEKWARRFRMMREAEGATDATGESSTSETKAEGQSDADVKGQSSSNDEGDSTRGANDQPENGGDKDKPRPE